MSMQFMNIELRTDIKTDNIMPRSVIRLSWTVNPSQPVDLLLYMKVEGGQDKIVDTVASCPTTVREITYQMQRGLEPGSSYYFKACGTSNKLSCDTRPFAIEEYPFKLGPQWSCFAVTSDGTVLQRKEASGRSCSSSVTLYNLMRQGLSHKGIAYYECTIVNKSKDAVICIGLANPNASNGFRLEEYLVGMSSNSFGFLSSGEKVRDRRDKEAWHIEEGRDLSPAYGINDTIGVCYSHDCGSIAMTKNGVLVGVGWSDINLSATGKLHPVVGASESVTVQLNFGNSPAGYSYKAPSDLAEIISTLKMKGYKSAALQYKGGVKGGGPSASNALAPSRSAPDASKYKSSPALSKTAMSPSASHPTKTKGKSAPLSSETSRGAPYLVEGGAASTITGPPPGGDKVKVVPYLIVGEPGAVIETPPVPAISAPPLPAPTRAASSPDPPAAITVILEDLAALPVAQWTVNHTALWVRSKVGLPQYEASFVKHVVDGEVLVEVTEEDLKTTLGVLNMHCRKIMNAIDAIKKASRPVPFTPVAPSEVVAVYDTLPSLEPGPQNYTIIKGVDIERVACIGKGYFGEVWKVRYRGSFAVAKYLPLATVDEIVAEAVVMERVKNHPNILPFYGLCLEGGNAFLLSEFCSKGSVEQLYIVNSRSTITVGECLKILKEAAAGIFHLHLEGVIHRDIACRNILLDESLRVRVCDFGLSRLKKAVDEDKSSTFSSFGPIGWMAPESIRPCPSSGKYVYSNKSDVYMFGMTAVELLLRERPYKNMNLLDIVHRVPENLLRPVFPDRLRGEVPEVVELVSSCLQNNPADRITMDALIKSCERILDLYTSDGRSLLPVAHSSTAAPPPAVGP